MVCVILGECIYKKLRKIKRKVPCIPREYLSLPMIRGSQEPRRSGIQMRHRIADVLPPMFARVHGL